MIRFKTGTDFCEVSEQITVAAGATQATWTLGILGDTDTDAETDETIHIFAVAPAGWSSSGHLTITIRDDDSSSTGSGSSTDATPSTPTGLSVSAGSTTALISWSSGGGVGGTCASDEYYVSVYEMIQSFPEVAESTEIEGASLVRG